MRKACPRCGRIQPCPAHPVGDGHRRGHRSHNRDRATQARFRRQVLARDGNRCVVCGSTTDLRACHRIPLAQGGSDDPANGVTLCAEHDRATDPHAR